MNCIKCGYNWVSRTAKPKSCPRCKTRLDYKTAPPIENILAKELKTHDNEPHLSPINNKELMDCIQNIPIGKRDWAIKIAEAYIQIMKEEGIIKKNE